jgi:hypothetical protein
MSKATAGRYASKTHQPQNEETKIISPAARKFAEYLARRMVPMIESNTRGPHQPISE